MLADLYILLFILHILNLKFKLNLKRHNRSKFGILLIMVKIYAFNLFYDILEFFKANLFKFIVTFAIFALGLVLGIKNALAVADINSFLIIKNGNIISVLVFEKSALKYFWIKFFIIALVSALVLLFSFNYILSFLNFVLLFVYSYFLIFYFVVYIILFKISILPLMIFCLIPFFIASYLLLSFMVIMSINRGREIRLCGCNKNNNVLMFIKCLAPLLIIMFLVILIEAILANLFSLGVTL